MKKQIIKSERIVYSEKCKVCKKEIKGFSESALVYNMRLHREKHQLPKSKDLQKDIKNELSANHNAGQLNITKEGEPENAKPLSNLKSQKEVNNEN